MYMIRKKALNPSFKEVHGHYRIEYGEPITIMNGDVEEDVEVVIEDDVS